VKGKVNGPLSGSLRRQWQDHHTQGNEDRRKKKGENGMKDKNKEKKKGKIQEK
jgi:hypothetical protein